ncbi:MAG: hypothetical protein LUM44_09705 [Pyrinomonadaceae bacterium]|nr:hypothetical protein [Pyrinomonadaceae bacterium]
MEINTILTTIGLSSIITLVLTKAWDWWREKVKNKNEDRKLLRKALTNLTNLYQNLLCFDFKSHLDISQDILLEQFKTMGANPENLKELELKEKDKSSLVTLQVESATEKLKSLNTEIADVADKLSEIKPLMASEIYEIQPNIAFQSMEKMLKTQLADGKERDDYSFEMIGNYQNEMFLSFKDKMLERIRPFILQIAEEIDEKTLEETKQYLEYKESERKQLLEGIEPDKINEFVKKMVEVMFTAHFKSLGNNLPDEIKQAINQENNSDNENSENENGKSEP